MLSILKKFRRRVFLYFPNSRIIASILLYRYFGLNKMDSKLRKYLSYRKGFFVELGANDGLKQSNSKHFELFRGWTGVLIEPDPNNYRLLEHNRSKNSKSFHAACVSRDFRGVEISMMYSDLMTTPLEGRNEIEDARGHAKLGEKFWGGLSYEFVAPARTLDSILGETNAPYKIQFLSLDVEGAELEVLQGVDLMNYSFDFMLIETRNLLTLQEFLESKSYFLVDKLSDHDYLFKNMPNSNSMTRPRFDDRD